MSDLSKSEMKLPMFLTARDLLEAARVRRVGADLHEILAELRNGPDDEQTGAVVRLFRGYCD